MVARVTPHDEENLNPQRVVWAGRSGRYDALTWLEDADALHPLRHEQPPREPELETLSSGF
jgi:hypothetical protein